MPPTLPTQYTSERLLLRRYRPEDAVSVKVDLLRAPTQGEIDRNSRRNHGYGSDEDISGSLCHIRSWGQRMFPGHSEKA